MIFASLGIPHYLIADEWETVSVETLDSTVAVDESQDSISFYAANSLGGHDYFEFDFGSVVWTNITADEDALSGTVPQAVMDEYETEGIPLPCFSNPFVAAGFIILLPLFEELVFCQWLYTRIIDRVNVWFAAVGSSWFFMLAHAFNPQVGMLISYMPTLFSMGLILFWIRHRFGSFSLAALAHMVNNGAFLILGWWTASSGKG